MDDQSKLTEVEILKLELLNLKFQMAQQNAALTKKDLMDFQDSLKTKYKLSDDDRIAQDGSIIRVPIAAQ